MGDMRIEDSFTQGPGPPSWVLGTARHYSPGHTWGRSSKTVQRWPLPQAEYPLGSRGQCGWLLGKPELASALVKGTVQVPGQARGPRAPVQFRTGIAMPSSKACVAYCTRHANPSAWRTVP